MKSMDDAVTQQAPRYQVTATDTYIYLKYLHEPSAQDMREANAKILDLHQHHGLSRLLCDLRQLSGEVHIGTQVEGVKLLWQLRDFEKFAFITNDNELERIVASSFNHLKFLSKLRTFNDEPSAITWLTSAES